MENVLVLKNDVTRFLPEKKVIKAAEYAAYLEAHELIAQASKQADKLIEEAKVAYEAEKKRGYEDGLDEGREKMSEKMLDTVAEAVNYFEGLEQKTVDVVTQALNRILGEMDKGELIRRVVTNALEVARTQKQVSLRVAPSQVEVLRSQLDEILAKFPSINYIDIAPDSRLKEGGCILETEMGFVDASIDVQLEALRKALVRATSRNV